MEQLKLTFDPLTIEHLGVKMYSQLPNAVAELVANAYDADASLVEVIVSQAGGLQALTVKDNGHGMSPTDIQEKYLRIGRNRRDEGEVMSESGARRVSGKKGLGKLALFGIGSMVEVSTKRAGTDTGTNMKLSWNDILGSTGGDYYPPADAYTDPSETHGTTIVLSDLKRSTAIQPEDLARSLSRLFNFPDETFSVAVVGTDGERFPLGPDLRLESVEIESIWSIPKDVVTSSRHQFLPDHGIDGVVIASEKPLPQGMRGVSLYANGRLLNDPEFFGASESSFAYSYLSGYLNVDYLDEIVPDVISTDRRSINWDDPNTSELREELKQLMFTIESQRRDLRKTAKEKEVQALSPAPVDEWVATVQDEGGREALGGLLEALSSPDIEMPESDQAAILDYVAGIAPLYPDLHWTHLHLEIQDAAAVAYKEGRYYDAVDEAIKRYLAAIRTRASLTEADPMAIVNGAFKDNGKLAVFSKYMAMTEYSFTSDTSANVEAGQRSMSAGIVSGFRNPLSHEEKAKLHASGAFNHRDCLDALSILSHLHRRLDDATDRAS